MTMINDGLKLFMDKLNGNIQYKVNFYRNLNDLHKFIHNVDDLIRFLYNGNKAYQELFKSDNSVNVDNNKLTEMISHIPAMGIPEYLWIRPYFDSIYSQKDDIYIHGDLNFDVGLLNINLESLVVCIDGSTYLTIETDKHITPKVFKNLNNLINCSRNIFNDRDDYLSYIKYTNYRKIDMTYSTDMTQSVDAYLVDINRFTPGIFNIDTTEAKLLYVDQKHYIRSVKDTYEELLYMLSRFNKNQMKKDYLYNLLYEYKDRLQQGESVFTMDFLFTIVVPLMKSYIKHKDLLNIHGIHFDYTVNQYLKNEVYKQIYFNTLLFNRFGNTILIRIDNTKLDGVDIDPEYEAMLDALIYDD